CACSSPLIGTVGYLRQPRSTGQNGNEPPRQRTRTNRYAGANEPLQACCSNALPKLDINKILTDWASVSKQTFDLHHLLARHTAPPKRSCQRLNQACNQGSGGAEIRNTIGG